MKKAILALAVLLGTVTNVEASTTSIHATPTSSVVGDKVTFTATFTSSCPGTLTTHYFTIDGKVYNGTVAQSGQAGSETLSTSALAAGTHSVYYYWKVNGTICRGTASMTFTVALQPSPSPSPSPIPSPSPTPSISSVTLVASKPSDPPLLGYLGGALIVLALGAGVALMLLARRTS